MPWADTDCPVGAGKSIAHDHYEDFDSHRRKAEAIVADSEDIKALEAIEIQAKQKGGAK